MYRARGVERKTWSFPALFKCTTFPKSPHVQQSRSSPIPLLWRFLQQLLYIGMIAQVIVHWLSIQPPAHTTSLSPQRSQEKAEGERGFNLLITGLSLCAISPHPEVQPKSHIINKTKRQLCGSHPLEIPRILGALCQEKWTKYIKYIHIFYTFHWIAYIYNRCAIQWKG